MDDREVERLLGKLDRLLARVETMPGGDGQLTRETVTALAQVYGETLSRMVGAAGADLAAAMAGDDLIGHMLALHGMHPDPPDVRAAQVLAEVGSRPPAAAFVPLESLRRKRAP